MRKQSFGALVILLVFSFVFAGCSTPATTPGASSGAPAASKAASDKQYGGNFVLIHAGTIPTLGAPFEGAIGQYSRIVRPALEPLILTDLTGKPYPYLAESTEVAADGKTITFKLRKGIKFHDGTDFNAAAVKWNFESWGPAGTAVFGSIASMDVVDDHTLRLNMKAYDALFLLNLTSTSSAFALMVSPTAAQKPTTDANKAKDHLVGTGPFKLDSYQRDAFAKFTKFSGYWQPGKPYVDSLEIRWIADSSTRIMAYKAGQGQFLDAPLPQDAVDLGKQGHIAEASYTTFIQPLIPDGANKDSPFADLKVRQAVFYAIDSKAIADGIGMGFWKQANEFAGDKDPWYIPGLARTFDPAKAKQLLKDAGYPNGFKTTLTMDTRAGEESKQALAAVQSYLKEVGIEAEIKMVDVAVLEDLAKKGWTGLLMPAFPNPSQLAVLYTRFGVPTYYVSRHAPAGYHESWAALKTEPNDEKRLAALKGVVQSLYDNMSVIPVWQVSPPIVYSKQLHDFAWSVNPGFAFEPANVWMGK